jgi:hypothetical protein
LIQRITILAFFAFLVSCTPTNYVYVKKFNHVKPKIEQVLIMVEYLDVKDDIKGLWNFEETTNLTKQDELYTFASAVVKSKGYELSPSYLKTSGLIIDRSFLVDHYIQKQKQEMPISPPYIVRSVNLEDSTIRSLEILLAQLNRPMSAAMADLRSFVVNDYSKQTQSLELPKNTALLIIQTYRPRVSLFSNVDIGFSASNFSNSTSIGLGGGGQRPTSYAYFIHADTGDLLWSNKTGLITEGNQQKFFTQLPLMKTLVNSL